MEPSTTSQDVPNIGRRVKLKHGRGKLRDLGTVVGEGSREGNYLVRMDQVILRDPPIYDLPEDYLEYL